MPEQASPVWLAEHGIGENRWLLVKGGQVLAAQTRVFDEMGQGTQVKARLVTKLKGTRRGVAILANGTELLVDQLPPGVTEGQTLDLVITRTSLAERGRLKRAQARLAGQVTHQPDSELADAEFVRRFPAGLWEDVWYSASSGSLDFPGGEILLSVTPAMTLIDIDGIGAPRDVALAALPAIAQALAWFDIGGNIGIDFPTLAAKADRRAVDEALGAMLGDWPHERTAMNGFGFVQIVARLERPSLLHRFAHDRLGMAARMALRRAQLAADHGTGRVLELTVHPAIRPRLKPGWLASLESETGRELRIETDPGLAIEAAHAQLVEA